MPDHGEDSSLADELERPSANYAQTILGGLNDAQRAAVTAEASVVQILAPPGSGKTKTLTSRVAYLLAHFQCQPLNILCMTFTIKSAREMRERIATLIGSGLESKIVLGTFHSVCRRYLVRYGHLIDIKKGFGIADSSDSLNAIKRIVKRLKLSLEPRVARNRISRAKARYSGYEELRSDAAKKFTNKLEQQEFLRVFEEYQSYLETCNLLDYDDLLLRCVELLRQHPECVSNVEAVLVDEFQDTNSVQFDLMRLFASKRHHITTVGDPDQSIYGWRSAEVKNLTKMQTLYPETLVLNLEDNYRSSGAILAAALDVIEQDESRPSKSLQPTHCLGTRPVFRKLPSSHVEGAWVVSEIERCMNLTGHGLLKASDFAILLRSASLSRQIEAALGKAGIPYRMVGGARFFDRVEIKILLNYLRVVAHPDNSEAFSAILNVPSRRIGDNTIKSLIEEAQSKGLTLFAFVRATVQGNISRITKLLKSAEQGLASLMNLVLTARNKLAEDLQCYPDQLLAFVMKRLDFNEYLSKTYPDDHETRWANVEELMAQAADPSLANNTTDEDSLPVVEGIEEAETASQAEEALSKFLANVALSTELLKEDEDGSETNAKERVTISTIHAAKGLEWPVVFVPSAYEGSIPHSRAEDCDEERRLLYVAMTRAQALLYISWPFRNATSSDETEQSKFLQEKLLNRHFADRGPSLDLCDIESIANILRRDKPSNETVNTIRIKAEQVEDDLWPVDGGTWELGYSRDDRKIDLGLDFSAKRSRTADYRSATITKASTLSNTQRFQSCSAYSHPSLPLPTVATGFTSASMHMTTMQSANRSYGPDRSSKQSELTREPKVKHARKKGQDNQETLTRLWNRTSDATTPTSAVRSQSQPGVPAAAPLREANINLTQSAAYMEYNPFQKSSKRGGVADATAAEPFSQMEPHSISRTGTARPKVLMDSSPATTLHVFLSSSPPPDARPGSGGIDEARVDRVNLESSLPAATSRPSLTCHHTSMAQLHAGAHGARRTLGVKRSMTGWTASGGGARPFRPPATVGKFSRGQDSA